MQLFYNIIRIVELILLVTISILIVHIIYVSNDSATLIGNLNIFAVGVVWLFPISIPVATCVLISLIKSVFQFKITFNKLILGIHLFNIFVIPLMLLILPSTGEPTAHAMAENIRNHNQEIRRMVNLVEKYVGDDGGLVYEKVNGKILKLSIRTGGKWVHKEDIEALWSTGKPIVGISLNKLHILDAYMQAANVQGIEFLKEEQSYSILFRRWGCTDFVYKIYRSDDLAKKEREEFKHGKAFIWFNDTIAFVHYGIYPGNGKFVDYEKFVD